ncbi:uncharacterized protein VTP21DRAFT_10655 [Calcarisporiella thermophila]|uniref:uncharacterized protein n=1 Tax=Calcarisporiella thermophila TaxID=911321 RepID=UPI0037430173
MHKDPVKLNHTDINSRHSGSKQKTPNLSKMSDTGRKGFMEQAKEKMTPEDQKSTGQKISESVSGAADRMAAGVTPESQKSYGQQAADSARGGADRTREQGSSMLDKAKDALGMNKK